MEYWEIIQSILGKYGRYHILFVIILAFHQLRIQSSLFSYSLTSSSPQVWCLDKNSWNDLYKSTLIDRNQTKSGDLLKITLNESSISYIFPTSTNAKKFDFDSLRGCRIRRKSVAKIKNSNETCKNWIYETSNSGFSLIVEHEQCSERKSIVYLQGVILLAFGVGWCTTYWIAEMIGRWIPFVVFLGVDTAFTMVAAFITNFGLYCFVRFISVVSVGGIGCLLSIYVMEIIPKKQRTPMNFCLNIAFSVSYIWLSILGAFTHNNWFHLEIGCLMVNCINIIMVLFYLPESPQWLFMRNSNKPAREILTFLNNLHQSKADTLLDYQTLSIEIVNEKKWWAFNNLVNSMKMAKTTAFICLSITCHLTTYLFLTLNTELYWGAPVLKVLMFGFLDLVAVVVCYFLKRRVPYKIFLFALSITAAVCLVIGDFILAFASYGAHVNIFPYLARTASWISLLMWPSYCNVFYAKDTEHIHKAFFEIVSRVGVVILNIMLIADKIPLHFCYFLSCLMVITAIVQFFLPHVSRISGALKKANPDPPKIVHSTL